MATVRLFANLFFLLLLLDSALAVVPKYHRRGGKPRQPYPRVRRGRNHPSPSLAPCKTTPYPHLCTHILLSSSSPAAPLNRQIAAVSSFALSLTSSSYSLASHLVRTPVPRTAPKTYTGALQDCMDLMSNTIDQLRLSISRLSNLNSARSSAYELHAKIMDAQVSLSASYTFQDTCSDELHQHNAFPAVTAQLLKQVGDTTRAVTVALAMADTLQHRYSP